jgi:hypothetical protein
MTLLQFSTYTVWNYMEAIAGTTAFGQVLILVLMNYINQL